MTIFAHFWPNPGPRGPYGVEKGPNDFFFCKFIDRLCLDFIVTKGGDKRSPLGWSNNTQSQKNYADFIGG